MGLLDAVLEWFLGKPELDAAAETVSIRAKEIAAHFQQPSLSWHIFLAIFGEVQNGQIRLVSSWEQVQDTRVQGFAHEMLHLFTTACQNPKNYWKAELPDEIEDLKDRAVRLADQDAIGKTLKVRVKHLFLACLKMPSVKAVLLSADLDLKTLAGWAAPKIEEVFAEVRASAVIDIPFCRDVTREALEGRLNPLIGREAEIRRIIQILTRRTKNNPVLVGDPGVGKTAIVEGLAQRIVRNDVPSALKNARLLEWNLAKTIAGTSFRGEHEQRIQAVLDKVQAARESGQLVILFIDELHNLVTGGGEGAGISASEMIKPALARGLNCIGATTLDDYRRYIESDSALERRFQPVDIEEPTIEETIEILKGIRERYETHHGVKITDEAIQAAARLGARYVTDRFLPDIAVDLMDEGASRAGTLSADRVVGEDIAHIVHQWTGVPVSRLQESETEKLLRMEELLHQRIIGQDEAIRAVSAAVRRSRARLKDPKRPTGSFLFLGPTGVGKTELAKALAEFLFDDGDQIVRIDMSEYQEEHTVARLIGAPPGYVGHEEPGQLTEPIRHQQYQVVLFDEIEKAHPKVWNVLLQVLDDGRLTDGQGRKVNFTETIVIMTSNIGSQYMVDSDLSFGAAKAKVLESVRSTFRPEFFNRIDAVVVFHRLEKNHLKQIVKILLTGLQRRLAEQEITLDLTDAVKVMLIEKGYDPNLGARPLRRIIIKKLEEPLADEILRGRFKAGDNVIGRLNTPDDAVEFTLKDQG